MTWEGLNPPYRTIVADPPWAYTASRASVRKAQLPYTSMTLDEIARLPVGDLAAEAAHLYLWVTGPLILGQPDADGVIAPGTPTPLSVFVEWGFTFKTMLTWVKQGAPGMGWYFRGDTEHVLFGVRGDLPIEAAKRERNVFTARRGSHSQKPASFFDLVERVSPGPYVELFARQPRLGWDSWGKGYESGVA